MHPTSLNPKFNWKEARSLITDPDTQGLVLLTIAVALLGDQVFGNPDTGVDALDPAELYAEIFEATNSWLSEEGENKLQALMLAMEGDGFYRDSMVFLSVSNSLLDGDLGDMVNGIFETPAALECLWSIMEVELARDDEQGPPEFSQHVDGVLTEILRQEQEDLSEFSDEIAAEYADMLDRLMRFGLSTQEVKILDAEYAETMEALMEIEEDTHIEESA